ncbi:hypothetical protein ACTPEF_25895, partial [Clostridioides difficile]
SSLGGKVQTVATIGKMIPLILIIVFGFIKGQSSEVLNPFVGDATKEKGMLTVLEVALEMYARGIKLLPVDIYKSDATEFIVVGE